MRGERDFVFSRSNRSWRLPPLQNSISMNREPSLSHEDRNWVMPVCLRRLSFIISMGFGAFALGIILTVEVFCFVLSRITKEGPKRPSPKKREGNQPMLANPDFCTELSCLFAAASKPAACPAAMARHVNDAASYTFITWWVRN